MISIVTPFVRSIASAVSRSISSASIGMRASIAWA